MQLLCVISLRDPDLDQVTGWLPKGCFSCGCCSGYQCDFKQRFPRLTKRRATALIWVETRVTTQPSGCCYPYCKNTALQQRGVGKIVIGTTSWPNHMFLTDTSDVHGPPLETHVHSFPHGKHDPYVHILYTNAMLFHRFYRSILSKRSFIKHCFIFYERKLRTYTMTTHSTTLPAGERLLLS